MIASAIQFHKFHVEYIQFNKASDDFVNFTCIYICQRREKKVFVKSLKSRTMS